MNILQIKQLQKRLPAIRKEPQAREKIRAINEAMGVKIIVLDVDPTGCQARHDVKVLTQGNAAVLKQALQHNACIYLLTNSRAYDENVAVQMNREIVRTLQQIHDCNRFKFISRGDSTLRGHFYGEVKTMIEAAGPFDGILILPYFREGGRFTVLDTHYVLESVNLIPCHETEFAKDSLFGYETSHLPTWIEHKSQG